jgi:membrane-associated phospholipid phosphatase
VLGPALAGARVVLPTRYVALHLLLGLLATAAIMGFIVIAEEVVAGRAIANFDLAFADALRTNTSPRWQQIFLVITALGSTPLLLATSAGVYILLRFTRSWTTIAAVVAIALAWCLVMGFTRLYLGVHFLSDVVAGLIAATAWVAVCVSGIEVALRRSNRA